MAKEHYFPKGLIQLVKKPLFGGNSFEKILKKLLSAWGVSFVDPCCTVGNNPGTGGGGSADFSALQTFASNTDAKTALGAGKPYKSTTLIDGSPIILITV